MKAQVHVVRLMDLGEAVAGIPITLLSVKLVCY